MIDREKDLRRAAKYRMLEAMLEQYSQLPSIRSPESSDRIKEESKQHVDITQRLGSLDQRVEEDLTDIISHDKQDPLRFLRALHHAKHLYQPPDWLFDQEGWKGRWGKRRVQSDIYFFMAILHEQHATHSLNKRVMKNGEVIEVPVEDPLRRPSLYYYFLCDGFWRAQHRSFFRILETSRALGLRNSNTAAAGMFAQMGVTLLHTFNTNDPHQMRAFETTVGKAAKYGEEHSFSDSVTAFMNIDKKKFDNHDDDENDLRIIE